ncbi:hypothetical protein D9Q98_009133 [Chlorella vulgaris]|uniref:Uncharacterized protein n=1 Tax=Chlorella vulgaris TaxID=3077 RepID=A0A9D4TH79_CHLVU|nr:hypothetical protein D9Q98_009133 [Chlorella vulgaris]
MKADFTRSRLARARRAGTGVATLSATLTAMALGVHLRLMLQAYGFPEGMAAEVGAVIDHLILQDGNDFNEYANGLLNMVTLIDRLDLVNHRLKAYAAPTSADMSYWIWFAAGGFLSGGLFKLGLTPYWPVASWLLSSCLLASTAFAIESEPWWAVFAIPAALYAWLYFAYRSVVQAMGEDAALLQTELDKLASDAHLYPEQLQTVLQTLRSRGDAVLPKLQAARRAAVRGLGCLGLSVPPSTVGEGAAAAAAAAEGGEQQEEQQAAADL